MRARVLVPLFVPTCLLAVACGASSTVAGADRVPVTATDRACELGATTFVSGSRTFAVTNKGSDVTEVYVYADGGTRVVGEVENIGPGTTRDLVVTLDPGTYEVACKPGQKGDGIRTTITVTGEATATTAPVRVDREVAFRAKEYAFIGLGGFSAKPGELVRFTMTNEDLSLEHEFELFGPGGEDLGEIAELQPGQTGTLVARLEKPGTYTFKCTHDGHDLKGMTGTFTVT